MSFAWFYFEQFSTAAELFLFVHYCARPSPFRFQLRIKQLWLCMGLRWINVFVSGLSKFNDTESTSSRDNDFHWLRRNVVFGEIWETMYLWAFCFFTFAFKPKNHNCLFDKFKKCCREINTDLKLLLDKHGGAISPAVVNCMVNTVQPLAHVHSVSRMCRDSQRTSS